MNDAAPAPAEVTAAPQDKSHELALALLATQRAQEESERSRRRFETIKWLTYVVPFAFFGLYFLFKQGSQALMAVEPYVGIVEVRGMIGEDGSNSGTIIKGINSAFEDKNAKGVLIRFNSTGGGATQSALVHDQLLRMKGKHPDKKVVVVAEDVMASGAVLIGVGGDVIYAHPTSMVGSIGVKMPSYGYGELLKKVGVEYRNFSAGEHKNRLDGNLAVSDNDRAWAADLMAKQHAYFIDVVKKGRGDKLAKDERIFSGDVFLGSDALQLGLVDHLGDIRDALQTEFGTMTVKDFTVKPAFSMASLIKTSMNTAVQSAMAPALPRFEAN